MKRSLFLILILAISIFTFSESFDIGDNKSFWQFDVVKSNPNFEDGYYQTNFTCYSESDFSYIFVENTLIGNKDKKLDKVLVDKIQKRFDDYFPVLSEYFGPPSDLDENGKFIILISDIRDWFFYDMEIQEGMEPILGYYWFAFNGMNNNDYLTMDFDQPEIDAYGTLLHEYFHNIYDNVNPEPVNVADRAVNEALAHFAIFLNGTMDEDAYCKWQFSILKKDISEGKFLNPFDGTHDYFDIVNPDTHHCYANGYFFMYYISEVVLKSESLKKRFFNTLIYEEINGTSAEKLNNALYQMGIIDNEKDFDRLFFDDYRKFITEYLK
jgi:hypothetical protein